VYIGNDNIHLLAQNVGKTETASNVYNSNHSGKDNHTKLYHVWMHNYSSSRNGHIRQTVTLCQDKCEHNLLEQHGRLILMYSQCWARFHSILYTKHPSPNQLQNSTGTADDHNKNNSNTHKITNPSKSHRVSSYNLVGGHQLLLDGIRSRGKSCIKVSPCCIVGAT